jgi:hypothetical protein
MRHVFYPIGELVQGQFLFNINSIHFSWFNGIYHWITVLKNHLLSGVFVISYAKLVQFSIHYTAVEESILTVRKCGQEGGWN